MPVLPQTKRLALQKPSTNTSIIMCNPGSVRANHYHIRDWHYMYVLSGSFEYYYREHGSEVAPEKTVFKKGEMVFTPPMEDHACIFTEDTYLVVASRNPRDQETYESDVVRIELVTPS